MRYQYVRHLLIFSLMLVAACGCKKQAPPAAAASMDATTCAQNLQILDQCKRTWAESGHKTADDTPTMADLTTFVRHMPKCPGNGTYTLGKVGELPTCSIPEHNEAFKKLAANP